MILTVEPRWKKTILHCEHRVRHAAAPAILGAATTRGSIIATENLRTR